MYEMYGNASLRDYNLILEYKSPYPRQVKPLPHCQLQQNVQGDGNHRQAKRTTPFETSPPLHLSWNESVRNVADVSHTGRYLVLSRELKLVYTFPLGEETLFLYGVEAGKDIRLNFPERLDYQGGAKYSFSGEEMKLVALIPCTISGMITISVITWDNLAKKPELKTHSKVRLGTRSAHRRYP